MNAGGVWYHRLGVTENPMLRKNNPAAIFPNRRFLGQLLGVVVDVRPVLLGIALFGVSACRPSGSANTEGKQSMYVPKSNMYGIIPESPPVVAKKAANPQVEEAGFQKIRESLFAPETCLFKKPEYCVRDKDFIDPLIREVLDKYYDGVVPDKPDKLLEVQNSVAAKYRNALYAADGLHRVEKLLEQRFQNPTVEEQGTSLVVDFGVLPGTLVVGARWSIGISTSPHLTDGEWNTKDIAERFKKYHAQFPKVHAVRLKVSIPSRMQSSDWIYHYSVTDDRIVVITGNSPNRGLATPSTIGRTFDRFLKGEQSLHTKHLIHIRLSDFKL